MPFISLAMLLNSQHLQIRNAISSICFATSSCKLGFKSEKNMLMLVLQNGASGSYGTFFINKNQRISGRIPKQTDDWIRSRGKSPLARKELITHSEKNFTYFTYLFIKSTGHPKIIQKSYKTYMIYTVYTLAQKMYVILGNNFVFRETWMMQQCKD